MKPSRSRSRSTFSSSSTVTYTLHNDQTTPPSSSPDPIATSAASRIQSAYRAHTIRALAKKVSAVDREATELQGLIQRQETVDAIRGSERERLRINELLMGLLLRLDSVPGADPGVREARRKASRRIVGMQEVVDAICEAKLEVEEFGLSSVDWGEGYLSNWDRTMERMEEEVCRERGGDEMERYCAQYLGFRCLQRFLHQP